MREIFDQNFFYSDYYSTGRNSGNEIKYFKVAKQFADAFKPQKIIDYDGTTIVKYPLVPHERSPLREKMNSDFSQFSHLSRGPAFYNPLEKFYSALRHPLGSIVD